MVSSKRSYDVFQEVIWGISRGVFQEVIWGHLGVDLGSFRRSFEAIQGAISGHLEGDSGSLRGSFGITLGSSRGVKKAKTN